MRLGHDHVHVRVPATSANLGPGYDSLGLALALYDDIEVRAVASSGAHVEVTGQGAGELPDGEDHLVVRALRLALDHVGASQTGLHLTCTNRIPHGRGLGSSAAAVVAGIMAARSLVADPAALDDDVVLTLATALEGHPDNAAPAILGGATVAWCEDAADVTEDVAGAVPDGGSGRPGRSPRPRAVRLTVHPDLAPVVVVAGTRLSTAHARSVLPAHVAHTDAAAQVARVALLVEALAHRPDLLLPATRDRLHQEYRRSVMPDSLALVDALRARGAAAVVSGAGPTVLVLARGLAAAAGAARTAGVVVPADAAAATDADAAIAAAFGGAMGGWSVLRPGLDLDGALTERL